MTRERVGRSDTPTVKKFFEGSYRGNKLKFEKQKWISKEDPKGSSSDKLAMSKGFVKRPK